MSLSRRDFLLSAASLAAFSALHPLYAATTEPASPPPAAPPPTTPAAQAFYQSIGPAAWNELHARLQITNANIASRGLKSIRNLPGKFLTGYPYNEFYDWDLYFENLYLSYFGVFPYCFANLKEFLNRQHSDGYVNRSLIKQRDRQHFKPFLAQLVVLGCKQNRDDYAWLQTSPATPIAPDNGTYYNRLKKYLDKWFSYDADNNGLPVWNSADAAGTDNQWSRAGKLAAFEIEGVDLASYLVRELRAMAVIAHQLSQPADAAAFTTHADTLCAKINELFWDEQDGFYYDRNEKTKQLVKVKSATAFTPLFAGAATVDRAKRIINEHLLNEKEFWLPYPVASYAKTEPDYYQGSHNECNWRGPTWAPTNYMIFQGLRGYGYTAIAQDLATRLFNMAIHKNAMLREYYNAETGEGLGQTQFWGFTALYYVLPLELQLNYDASSLWMPPQAVITDQLGLHFPT
jgi:putative isomerase